MKQMCALSEIPSICNYTNNYHLRFIIIDLERFLGAYSRAARSTENIGRVLTGGKGDQVGS